MSPLLFYWPARGRVEESDGAPGREKQRRAGAQRESERWRGNRCKDKGGKRPDERGERMHMERGKVEGRVGEGYGGGGGGVRHGERWSRALQPVWLLLMDVPLSMRCRAAGPQGPTFSRASQEGFRKRKPKVKQPSESNFEPILLPA